MLRQFLGILWTDELWVIGSTDVDCAFDVCGAIGRVKVGVFDAVAVDFTNVEVFFYFLDFLWFNAVCSAPDFVALDLVGVV